MVAGSSRIGQRRQVVIPRSVLDAAGLKEGDFMDVIADGSRVLLKRKRLRASLESLTPTEAAKVRKGQAQLRAGESTPWREVKRELGY